MLFSIGQSINGSGGGETGLEYEDGTFFKHQSGTITVILK